jgi:ribonuclease HI
MRFGLAEWRENGWHWEHFGHMHPVKHADLWQRLDRALGIHEVQCRTLRIDAPHGESHQLNGPARVGARRGQRREASPAWEFAHWAGQWMKNWLTLSRTRAAQLL